MLKVQKIKLILCVEKKKLPLFFNFHFTRYLKYFFTSLNEFPYLRLEMSGNG